VLWKNPKGRQEVKSMALKLRIDEVGEHPGEFTDRVQVLG